MTCGRGTRCGGLLWKNLLVRWVFVGATALFGGERAGAAEFGVSGEVEVAGTRRWVSTNLTAWGDRAEWGGAQNQFSVAAYHADLQRGRVGTFAQGLRPAVAYIPGAVAHAKAGFWETLDFTIPSGEYPNGLVAVLHGRLTGQMTAWGWYGAGTPWSYASQTVTVAFSGPAGAPPSATTVLNYSKTVMQPESPFGLSQLFELKTWLALPGERYASPRRRQVSLAATLEGYASALGGIAAEESTEACSDFGASAQLLAVEAPPGVTWTSASGVFLADAPGLSPRLHIRLIAPRQVQLAWSTNWPDYTLERASCLPGAQWESVAGSPAVQEDQWVVSVEAGAGEGYFRLRRQ